MPPKPTRALRENQLCASAPLRDPFPRSTPTHSFPTPRSYHVGINGLQSRTYLRRLLTPNSFPTSHSNVPHSPRFLTNLCRDNRRCGLTESAPRSVARDHVRQDTSRALRL